MPLKQYLLSQQHCRGAGKYLPTVWVWPIDATSPYSFFSPLTDSYRGCRSAMVQASADKKSAD